MSRPIFHPSMFSQALDGSRRDSMASRRNSLLSLSLFDFPVPHIDLGMGTDPFAPIISFEDHHHPNSITGEAHDQPQYILTDSSEHTEATPKHSDPHAGKQYAINTVSPGSATPRGKFAHSAQLKPAFSNKHEDASTEVNSHFSDEDDQNRFKPFHEEKWVARYRELIQFYKESGHTAVPHTYPPNRQLARWVKRQRRQYKLRLEGKVSTMTQERQDLLDKYDFIWDSHDVNWQEKLASLRDYCKENGHCNVPSNYKDKKLATWVKCQRRQYKLLASGKSSAMTEQRQRALEKLGFEWEVRTNGMKDSD